MTKQTRLFLAGLLTANVLAWGMLGFYRTTEAQGDVQLPFRNAVEQRQDMIRELQEIKALLKEQNTLMRAQAAAAPAGRR